jgi:hypothetical protein
MAYMMGRSSSHTGMYAPPACKQVTPGTNRVKKKALKKDYKLLSPPTSIQLSSRQARAHITDQKKRADKNGNNGEIFSNDRENCKNKLDDSQGELLLSKLE